MNEDLKPCPFCLSKAILRNNPRGDMYWIDCGHNPTHCQTASDKREQVVELWNTRPAEDALRAELEQMVVRGAARRLR